MAESTPAREVWGSRIGLILAMAGNAIGLGNFLRFPVQAARNGGGAFMIPYFVALLLLGIPLMWVEWGLGRYGGKFGEGTAPGVFHRICKHPAGKYLGILGIGLPILFAVYYCYIESWTLGYAYFSVTDAFRGIGDRAGMTSFLQHYQGVAQEDTIFSLGPAYIFFLITIVLNIWILSKGLASGIEKLAKIAMPLLFLFAVILVVRVLTLGTPDPAQPGNSAGAGFAYLWNPDLSQLSRGSVWLAAAGQIFFTLSIGTGSILTYASYLKAKDDIALTGLTTSMTNEFAEVILGGSIAIPVAVAFFGLMETRAIAAEGSFNLGFSAMPLIFSKLPFGAFFGFLWFLLLFFAGITSSVALCSPAMSFLQDKLRMSRERAAVAIGVTIFLVVQPVILFLRQGFLEEFDYWVGTFGLVVFALVEILLFCWVLGMDKAWAEINEGADIRIPRVFYYILKYLAPLYLIALFVAWGYQDALPLLRFARDASGAEMPVHDIPFRLAARLTMLGMMVLIGYLVYRVYGRRRADA
jgi:SNF family Na+-dependent transporter